MTSKFLRKAALVASGAALMGGLAVAPAVAAPTGGQSAAASPYGCYTGRNLTNGWGKCTASGSYLWYVELDCTLGGFGESSTVSGPTKVYAYCSWGDVESVHIVIE